MKKIIQFLILGCFTFVIDAGLLTLLTNVFQTHYIYAGTISFLIACGVNYFYSTKYVFGESSLPREEEVFLFFLLSFVGLIIQNTTLWIFHGCLQLPLLFSKATGVGFGTLFNFSTRNKLLSQNKSL